MGSNGKMRVEHARVVPEPNKHINRTSRSTRVVPSTAKLSGEIHKKLHLPRVGQVVTKAPKRL
eukprot:3372931-Pleurochrysis_carterae.AAC.1